VPTYPTTFVAETSYSTGTTCTGTVSDVEVSPVGVCEAGSTTSSQYTANGTSVIYNTYTGTACAGTATVVGSYTNGQCASNTLIAYPDTAPTYALYTYSDASCTTLASSEYDQSGQCNSLITTSQKFITSTDLTQLQLCTYTDAACTTGSSCVRLPVQSCITASGITGGLMYNTASGSYYAAAFANAAPMATAAVMAIAVAVAAAVKAL